jgi:hypothetical protein
MLLVQCFNDLEMLTTELCAKVGDGVMRFDDGVVEQWFEQSGALSVGDLRGDDPAVENIDDDIEIEVAPFHLVCPRGGGCARGANT